MTTLEHSLNPLTDDAIDGLVPTFIATKADIDLAEQSNIAAAYLWGFAGRRVGTPERLLTIEFSDRVHRKMFGDVWRWAGRHCPHQTRTGVKPERINSRLEVLFVDARLWHDHWLHAPSERARRLHDVLCSISAYPGGNRRHARFMSDLYLHLVGAPSMNWEAAPPAITPLLDGPSATTRQSSPNALHRALDDATIAGPKELRSALDRALDRASP